MNKFFNKVFVNGLKNFSNQADFMKHKLTWFLVPLITLALLVSCFVFNCFTKKFDVGAMIGKNKTIIEMPLKDDIDSNTLKKVQNIATRILKFNCVAQKSIDYDKHINSVLGKDGLEILKITAFQSNSLTDQQKQLLFDELKLKFPDIIDLENVNDDIDSYTLSNLEINSQFWIQLLVVGAILLMSFMAYSAIKFKKLGIVSTCLAMTTNLVLSLGITFFTIALLTKKINLIFMTAMAIYFVCCTSKLFSEMAKESKNETDPSKIANSAISKNLPNALFTLFIAGTTSICALIASAIFKNPLLFYLAVSTLIGIAVNMFSNLFISPQLWSSTRSNKSISKKNKKETSAKLSANRLKPIQN